jgi:hypothetical protein
MYTYIGEVGGSLRTSLASTLIPTQANGYIGGNTTGFSDPIMDADIAALEVGLDSERQMRFSADMQRIYAEQLPALPLFFRAEAAGVPNWLHDARGPVIPATVRDGRNSGTRTGPAGRAAIDATDGQQPRDQRSLRGSNACCKPSPKKLTAMTVMKISSPG